MALQDKQRTPPTRGARFAISPISVRASSVLVGARQARLARCLEQHDFVIVETERQRPEIADQQRHVLAHALLVAVDVEIAAFRRETDAVRWIRQLRDRGEDVGILDEVERRQRLAGRLLDLVIAHVIDAPVGDGRHRDEDVGVRRGVHDGVVHLLRGLHILAIDAPRRFQRDRPGDQMHVGAGLRGRARERKPHLARRAVRDAAHRIERFERRTGGDQHAASAQDFRLEERADRFERGGWLEHPTVADFAARLRRRNPARALRRRRRAIARRCAASPGSATSGGSSRARRAADNRARCRASRADRRTGLARVWRGSRWRRAR